MCIQKKREIIKDKYKTVAYIKEHKNSKDKRKGLEWGKMFRPKITINKVDFHKLDSSIMLETEEKQEFLNSLFTFVFSLQETIADSITQEW